ncbi:MAG: AbrB/MazE/SpoVT family DNA-binding domain-containing protein [Deinococcus sp.]|nr:AbrB/MazE/SpoVT family DNA-binding domain-containing protein [Deinococcus sp.]
MAQVITVRMDEKGRLTIPKRIREELGVRPGDTFVFRRDGDVLHYVRAGNPFEALARHAVREYRAGRTKDVRELARKRGIPVDAQ